MYMYLYNKIIIFKYKAHQKNFDLTEIFSKSSLTLRDSTVLRLNNAFAVNGKKNEIKKFIQNFFLNILILTSCQFVHI
jgi:glycine betaine/choline ABC-type transport system substrate-binding protein